MSSNKVLSWLVSPVHAVMFILILLLFHPLQVLAHLVSPALHQRAFDLMNLCFLLNMRFFGGTRFDVRFTAPLPTDTPLIFVANHQSMYDLPLLVWHLRRFQPGFLAKKELGKWLPSISFPLRHLNCLLVDRVRTQHAIAAISRYGKQLARDRRTVCLFPEGTRARDGRMKPFRAAGLLTLLDACPGAPLVPIAIDGTWRIVKNNLLPLPYGTTVKFTVLPALAPENLKPRELIAAAEAAIRKELQQEAAAADERPA